MCRQVLCQSYECVISSQVINIHECAPARDACDGQGDCHLSFRFIHQPLLQPACLTDMEIVHMVIQDGQPNSMGLRIPLRTNWNLNLFQSLCTSRSDYEVLTYLRYGWLLNRNKGSVAQTFENHMSARKYPSHVSKYILKELKHNTLIGPFVTSPFSHDVTGVSPLSTTPKKYSTNRRVIVDLSWPLDGYSVNSLIPKDTFMDSPVKMVYPTIDLLCRRAFELGLGMVGWRKDMSRAFHQVPQDPLFWSILGIWWMGALFFDKAAVMGCRSAPYACQCTTNAIRHFMANLSYVVFNYIDDFMCIDNMVKAWKAYKVMAALLRDLGMQEAIEKSVPPSHIIEFLGIIFDLIRLIIVLPDDKLCEIRALLGKWQTKKLMSKKELQSLVGKLQFASACVRPGRVFVNRMYDTVSQLQDDRLYLVFDEVRRDIAWWSEYMNKFNGVSIMWMEDRKTVNEVLATDSCLTGMGGFSHGKFFHCEIPEFV